MRKSFRPHEIVTYMQRTFAKSRKRLDKAITKSFLYPDLRTLPSVPGKESQIHLFQGDCLLAVEQFGNKKEKTVLLDFASDTNPGGGWRGNQRGTQEESICKRSSLGVTLENATFPIPHHGAIWIPDVLVLPKGTCEKKELWCSVIAAALRGGAEGTFLQMKTDGILKLAAKQQADTVILGSWGCGAFGNELEALVRAWKSSITRCSGTVKNIVFAVMERDMAVYENILCL
jgi:hypothetical protein